MDIQEIERAMHVLACGETTYETVSRLAALKVVHDHLTQTADAQVPQAYSAAPAPQSDPPPRMTGSEFLEALSEVPYEDAMMVLDEHLEALKVVCPKEYESVMRRLWKLR